MASLAAIVVIAALGGMVNSIAGGGTLLTFPAIVALGVPPGLGSHVHWDRRLTGRLAAIPKSTGSMRELGWLAASSRGPGRS